MRRWLTLCAVAALVATVRADDDPVRVKLDRAKATYEMDTEKYRAAVTAWLDKREQTARDKSDKKAVDQVKAERQAFAEKGELSKTAPAALKSQLASTRAALESALKAAVGEYTKTKQDDKAAAVEKELEAFKAGTAAHPADAVKFGGKFYKVYDTTLSWHQAKQKCESMGGRLVVVTSEEENEFVAQLAIAARLPAVWLGATDEKKEGVWVWVNGTAVKYENWDRPQPNNAKGVEHYAVLLAGKKGMWWDYPDKPTDYPGLTGAGIPGFVCQWE